MRHKISFVAILSFWVILSGGCKKLFTKKIDQGTIVYDITYLTDRNENPIVVLLPKEMVTKFKNNNTITTVEGFFGTFKLAFLTKYDMGKKYTLLRVLDNKYVYDCDTAETPLGADDMHLQIFKTDSTVVYKNLTCKVAKVYCPSIDKDTFEVLYTNDINVKAANTNNLYKGLDGVLVKGKLKLMGITMEVKLKDIKPEDIDDEIFTIPADYKVISKKGLEELFHEFERQ